jgi:hypothetical protein
MKDLELISAVFEENRNLEEVRTKSAEQLIDEVLKANGCFFMDGPNATVRLRLRDASDSHGHSNVRVLLPQSKDRTRRSAHRALCGQQRSINAAGIYVGLNVTATVIYSWQCAM